MNADRCVLSNSAAGQRSELPSFYNILVEKRKEEIRCEWQDQSQQFCSATLAGADSLTCVTAVTFCDEY